MEAIFSELSICFRNSANSLLLFESSASHCANCAESSAELLTLAWDIHALLMRRSHGLTITFYSKKYSLYFVRTLRCNGKQNFIQTAEYVITSPPLAVLLDSYLQNTLHLYHPSLLW